MDADKTPISLQDRFVDLMARAILGTALLLPYPTRVAFAGWAVSRLVAPVAGWRRRVRENLALVLPDLPKADVERITRNVADNVGRTLIEIYSGDEFIQRVMASPIEGPGVAALNAAREAGRPIVLVTAHFGNYDAVRAKLSRIGFPMGALYRPMKNTAFNVHYLRAISAIAEPLFATDGRGIGGLVRHLKDGGLIGIVADVAAWKAPLLKFFGKPAHTPLSAADWAIKYGAELIPVFGLRQPDGLTFRIHVAEPIAHTTPEEMMQRYNDAVEDLVRQFPDQWFWIHRRWKTRGT